MTNHHPGPARRAFIGGSLGIAAGIPLAAAWPRTAGPMERAASGSAVPFRFRSAGARIEGMLHLPDGRPRAAIVISGPWTSVKEQSPALYAEALARRGFAALAFDHRHFGDSEGDPRQLESPEAKVEDIRNATTALAAEERTRDLAVLGLGLCAGGGYMARAVAADPRLRAFAGVVGAYTDAAGMRARLGEAYEPLVQRGRYAERRRRDSGVTETIRAVAPDGGNVAMPFQEAFEYYGTPRGAVANYVNGFAVESYAHVLAFDILGAAPSLRVPSLIVHSERAALPDLARRFFTALPGPKAQLWLESRGHVDFYDDPALIGPAAEAIARHFTDAA